MQAAENKENLIRKQFMISPAQAEKLALLGRREKSSSAVVRKAIDAYNPESIDAMDENELLELVAARLKEALDDTAKTIESLNKTFRAWGVEEI